MVIIGDFNAEPSDMSLRSFMEVNSFVNHIKSNPCMKSNSGKCIDLILSRKTRLLKHSNTFETGLSDFHLLVYTVLKTTFQKLPPKRMLYRCYKKFDVEIFLNEFNASLQMLPTGNFEMFLKILTEVLLYR